MNKWLNVKCYKCRLEYYSVDNGLVCRVCIRLDLSSFKTTAWDAKFNDFPKKPSTALRKERLSYLIRWGNVSKNEILQDFSSLRPIVTTNHHYITTGTPLWCNDGWSLLWVSEIERGPLRKQHHFFALVIISRKCNTFLQAVNKSSWSDTG